MEESRVIVQVGGKDLSFLIILELLGLHFLLTQVKFISPRSLMGLTDGLAIALLAFPQFNSSSQGFSCLLSSLQCKNQA